MWEGIYIYIFIIIIITIIIIFNVFHKSEFFLWIVYKITLAKLEPSII